MCSDQEAVDLVRKVENPQEASRILVDHALSKFSTDNLSVMVVRFDPRKVRENTSIDIGVQHDTQKHTISEAEMIVSEARRNSGIPAEGQPLSEQEDKELQKMVIKEQEEEQEAGPEMTAEGQRVALKQAQAQATAKLDGAGNA